MNDEEKCEVWQTFVVLPSLTSKKQHLEDLDVKETKSAKPVENDDDKQSVFVGFHSRRMYNLKREE